MNPYEVTRSAVTDDDTHVVKRVDVEVMNTASNSRRGVRVRPLASSEIAQSEGRNTVSNQELCRKAETFVRSELQNEEFVRKMEAKDRPLHDRYACSLSSVESVLARDANKRVDTYF